MLFATRRFLRPAYRAIDRAARRGRYLLGGRKPWSVGYVAYRNEFTYKVLRDSTLCKQFRYNRPLPQGYGARLDERVVEYPWVISRLAEQSGHLLDAGSSLNQPALLELPGIRDKLVVVYTLAPEGVVRRQNVSYVYGDLRHTILCDKLFDEIVCISTLEHIGMDNTLIYTCDERYHEAKLLDYLEALREFRRLLMPGGRLLFTVPYGAYQNLGWLQQFDRQMLCGAIRVFGGSLVDEAFYRYTPSGWVLSHSEACADSLYFDVHQGLGYDSDLAAAARAVACIELVR